MIKDALSNSKISRQRKYQIRHQRKGLCITCSEAAVNASHCAKHRDQVLKNQRRRRGFKPWRKGSRGRPPINLEEIV